MSASIPQGGLTAITWVFTSAAVGLTIGRYVIRFRMLGKLLIDDWIHGLASIVMVGYMITYTIMFPLNYSVELFVAGKGDEPSVANFNRYFHLEIAVTLLFWVIIYAVKLSFLFFYRSIFGVSTTFIRAWWFVMIFTVLTFWICFIFVFWACGTPSQLFVVESCLSPSTLSLTSTLVTMWCVLNVISDVTILPLWMLRGLHVTKTQKLGLAAIFALGLADTVFDIVRTVYTVNGGAVALDTVWDILEPAIAVIASSLPTYRGLVSPPKKPSYNHTGYTGNTLNKTSQGVSLSTLKTARGERLNSRSASEENIFVTSPRDVV
ncbi:Satratoxin biosynthesis SC1 cluster protein [Lachnellula suecica]|uniref:Satratoxin biosynthesis SC1 cluster protein n=1 Tax=Lachnellula suecica TaxID=602035 RepID=A0A8T9C4H5_9HELO|nr:Satratoxin biosynthesis SC1 cluster protein [Lachnellula suecica]